MRKLTTKDFIDKAKDIHGEKFDYGKVDYINAITEIIITCRTHGDYFQRPNHHLYGSGCPKCRGYNKTTEDIIKEFKEKHGDKYDYSLVKYINNKTKVKIICPIHGEFFQTKHTHLITTGCPKCATITGSNKQKYTNEEFIERAIKIHGDKYDYSQVDYIDAKTKIKIICRKHNSIFEQNPNSHLSGSGCNLCGIISMVNEQKYTNEEFIERAIEIHGDKYDYSQIDYKGANTKIRIKCHIHGIYNQTPSKHINSKHGCPKCSGYHKTTETIIEEFKKVHGNLYDYSLVNFINMISKIKIICKSHGVFEIDPHHHISSRAGCPKCKSSKGEKIVRDILTKYNILFEEQKRFPDCKYKKQLPFDFYLPNHNITIEYDGIQHHKPYSFRTDSEENKQKNFELVKLKDNIKTDYCIKNNIQLIRISYQDKYNILYILNRYIMKNKSIELMELF